MIKEEVAAQELLDRRYARTSLIGFTKYTYPLYKVDPVHELIAETLDQVVAGEIERLMIFAPPQNGKSELTSVRLPAYWMGKRPNDPVILTSYGASLAESKSRQARDIVESNDFKALFGDLGARDVPSVETRRDSRSVSEWGLAPPYRGGMFSAGAGGPITGRGAMLGIIDDPIENWEQAQSPTYRNKVWDWYRTTFRTRIWEGGAIVLVMTRWDEDDLAGRILKDQGNEWTVLRLPAMAESQEERDTNNKYLGLPLGEADPLGREEGEPLSPSRFTKNALNSLKKDVGNRAWSAEYQGVPRAAEGNRFRRSWFPIVESAPAVGTLVRYWDKAGTEKKEVGADGAATAGVLMLKANDGLYYIMDAVQVWESAYKRELVIKQTAELDAMRFGGKGRVSIYIEQEPGSGGKESKDATIKALAGYVVRRDMPRGAKDVRLIPFEVQCEAGNVRVVRGAWNHSWIEEMISIGSGGRRDQADATAGAFDMLTSNKPTPVTRAKTNLYGRK